MEKPNTRANIITAQNVAVAIDEAVAGSAEADNGPATGQVLVANAVEGAAAVVDGSAGEDNGPAAGELVLAANAVEGPVVNEAERQPAYNGPAIVEPGTGAQAQQVVQNNAAAVDSVAIGPGGQVAAATGVVGAGRKRYNRGRGGARNTQAQPYNAHRGNDRATLQYNQVRTLTLFLTQ